IGGLIESFGGPESIEIDGLDYNYSLSLNQDFLFVGSLCTNKLGLQEYYLNACKHAGVDSIDLSNVVSFAQEANGATYFYDRNTKAVSLLSHDHAFSFVEPLPDQPANTMYQVIGAQDFIAFVELLARQWKVHLTSR
ncbi:MAG: hypothetical protein AAF597_12135, partial [Bacteroidota bacterium]